jgi:hypothetical protein
MIIIAGALLSISLYLAICLICPFILNDWAFQLSSNQLLIVWTLQFATSSDSGPSFFSFLFLERSLIFNLTVSASNLNLLEPRGVRSFLLGWLKILYKHSAFCIFFYLQSPDSCYSCAWCWGLGMLSCVLRFYSEVYFAIWYSLSILVGLLVRTEPDALSLTLLLRLHRFSTWPSLEVPHGWFMWSCCTFDQRAGSAVLNSFL